MTDDEFKDVLKESPSDDRTSPKAVAYDVLASLILLCGAWIIERIKVFFPPPGPPAILLIILNLSELTLLTYFVVALVRAIISVYKELNVLVSLIKEGQTIESITKLVQAINNRRIKAEDTRLSYRLFWLGLSFYLTLVFSTFILLLFWLSGLPVNWGSWRVALIIVSGIVFLQIVSWFNERLRIRLLGMYEASGISIACLIQVLFIAVLLYVTGYSTMLGNSVHKIITAIYLDRAGLIWSISSIVVFAMILSMITTIALEQLVIWRSLPKS